MDTNKEFERLWEKHGHGGSDAKSLAEYIFLKGYELGHDVGWVNSEQNAESSDR